LASVLDCRAASEARNDGLPNRGAGMTPAAELRDVRVTYPGGVGALAGVSLALAPGGVTGLVGESGCGKTTLCRVLLGLQAPDAGEVLLEGEALAGLLARDRLAVRRRVGMLLQDAAGSLSPRMTLRRLLAEPAAIHGLPRAEAWGRVEGLMLRLGLAAALLDKYPHQVSGGQARRVAVVRALVLRPSLLVADEPTAGLDVSVQGDLLNLLMDLQAELGLTLLVCSHNLPVIRRVTAATVVMYLGEIVEHGPTAALFDAPGHPYTAALLATRGAPGGLARMVLWGEVPSPVHPPSGCRFHTRCPQAQPRCAAEHPELREVAGHQVRCHFPLTDTLPPAHGRRGEATSSA